MQTTFDYGSLGSGALGFIGGLLSNNTNKKLAREANALQYKMFTEANDFSNQQRIAQN